MHGIVFFSCGYPTVYFSSGWETLKSYTFGRKLPKFSRRASRADKKSSFCIAFLNVSADFIFFIFYFRVFSKISKNLEKISKKLKGLQNLQTYTRILVNSKVEKKTIFPMGGNDGGCTHCAHNFIFWACIVLERFTCNFTGKTSIDGEPRAGLRQ